MSLKESLQNLKKELMKNNQQSKEYTVPVLIPERGFILFPELEDPVVFNEEYHRDGIKKAIQTMYPEEYPLLISKFQNDQSKYEYYLIRKGAVLFLNHSLISLNEYQIHPYLITNSNGILYIPENLESLTIYQVNWLLKYIHDFKRMNQIHIELASITNQEYQLQYHSISIEELQQRLSRIQFNRQVQKSK